MNNEANYLSWELVQLACRLDVEVLYLALTEQSAEFKKFNFK